LPPGSCLICCGGSALHAISVAPPSCAPCPFGHAWDSANSHRGCYPALAPRQCGPLRNRGPPWPPPPIGRLSPIGRRLHCCGRIGRGTNPTVQISTLRRLHLDWRSVTALTHPAWPTAPEAAWHARLRACCDSWVVPLRGRGRKRVRELHLLYTSLCSIFPPPSLNLQPRLRRAVPGVLPATAPWGRDLRALIAHMGASISGKPPLAI